MNRRDLIWAIITVLVSIILAVLFYGSDGTLSVNIYDTYFVIANSHFWFGIMILVFSVSYLVKCFNDRFLSKSSNVVLLISLGLATFMMVPIGQFLFMASGYANTLNASPTAEFWKKIYYGFLFFYGLLIAIFGISAFKTGKNGKS